MPSDAFINGIEPSEESKRDNKKFVLIRGVRKSTEVNDESLKEEMKEEYGIVKILRLTNKEKLQY